VAHGSVLLVLASLRIDSSIAAPPAFGPQTSERSLRIFSSDDTQRVHKRVARQLIGAWSAL
jgi:hypothetical protein